MGTASLVLGIIGICTSFIPIVNNASFILALIGALLAIVALITKKGKGMAIAGLIICIVTCAIVVQAQKSLSDSINNAVDTFSNDMNEAVNEFNDSISVDNESADKITLNKFEQIQNGMTYEEVVAIVGEEGTISTESSYGDSSMKTYTWSNGIATASITFDNEKVSAKSQVGLGE